MATKTGDSSNNRLRGTETWDTLNGLGGNDILWGLGGNDTLKGGDDRDVLIGGPGDDSLYGGAGDDFLIDTEGDRDFFIGGPGADVMVGSGGNRTAMYLQSPAGVTVNLATGRGQGGDAEGDVLIGIPRIIGSNHDDTLTGDEQDNQFYYGRGADVVDGGGGIDIMKYFYLPSDSGVTVDLGVTDAEGWTTVTGADGNVDKLKNIENLAGNRGADTLRGDENANKLWGWEGNDVLEGRGGADTLDGGSDNDTASYAHSPGGVTVDLTLTGPQATENNHDAAGDTLIGIENLEGSNYADILMGDENANNIRGGNHKDVLEGRGGADVLDGGSNWGDIASYAHSPGGVTVDLTLTGPQATENNHDAAGDTLIGIEFLWGSNHSDRLTGDDGSNVLEGRGGADVLDGGLGTFDVASYESSPGGVTVDLTLTGPQATGNNHDAAQATENNHDAAGDTLIGIEHLVGSNHSDRLTGDDERNTLQGRDGNDYLYGGDNRDTLYGGIGNDMLYGGDGNDYLDGDAGNDHLYGGIGNDRLYGRTGADTLYGGTGADTFSFWQESVVDTGNAEETRTLADETDTVTDFSGQEGDSLHLRHLKDHSLFAGGRELSLLRDEGAAFTGVKGQVKWWWDGENTSTTDDDVTHVQVDLDGDGNANFQVDLTGLHSLVVADFDLG